MERLADAILHQRNLRGELRVVRAQEALHIYARPELPRHTEGGQARRAELRRLPAALLPLNHALGGFRVQRPGGPAAIEAQGNFAFLRRWSMCRQRLPQGIRIRDAELANPRVREDVRVHVEEAYGRRKVHSGEVGISDQRPQLRAERGVRGLARRGGLATQG